MNGDNLKKLRIFAASPSDVPNDPGVLVHIGVEVSDLPGGKGVKAVDKTL